MVKKDMSKKTVVNVDKRYKKSRQYLIAFPLIGFLIKVVVISNTPFGGWYGADGENYMAGVDGLLKEGFFSTASTLSYWPSGYSILIWPLATISITKVYYLLSFIQSVFFAYSTYFFTMNLSKTKFAYLAVFTSFLISFNPTLALNSLSVGYETPVAACLMMAIGTLIKEYKAEEDNFSFKSSVLVAAWFALSIFMQPRFLLVGLMCVLFWAFKFNRKRNAVLLLAVSVGVMAIAPAVMIYRNFKVINEATISTNLSTALAIGAGDQTRGGYIRTGPEVQCKPDSPHVSLDDNQKIQCILKWYLDNPLKTIKLSYNKSQFFWSPWSGPLVEGTMARNPWLKIAPVQGISKTSEGNSLVYGPIGKTISYLWIIGQILLLVLGYRELRRYGSTEKFFANLFLIPIVISWLISIATIGDHRFRIPTMALSLILQAAGMLAVKRKLPKVS